MRAEQINFFQTFGFSFCKQLLSAGEMADLSRAFNRAMEKARGGAPRPQPGSADPRPQPDPRVDPRPQG